jgi:Ricin-type beta-trefoil lectin domain/Putative Ig domain
MSASPRTQERGHCVFPVGAKSRGGPRTRLPSRCTFDDGRTSIDPMSQWGLGDCADVLRRLGGYVLELRVDIDPHGCSLRVRARPTRHRHIISFVRGRSRRVVDIANPGPQNRTVGTRSSLKLTATASTGSAVTFTATGLPAGMVLGADGLLSGTPTMSGTTTVTVTASDAAGASATTTFVLTVNAADGAGGPTGTITGAGGLCVDLPSGSNRDGTPIQLYTCDGTNEQEWTARSDGTLQAEGKCLDIARGGTISGAAAQLSTCSGALSQHWQAGANGELVNTASGLCLDVSGPQAASGATLSLGTCKGTGTQRWVLPN